MFYSLIRFSIYKPFIVVAFISLLTLFCGWKLLETSLDIFPEFSPKLVIIQTESPGMSSSQVESLVTRPLETLLNGIPDLHSLKSESIAGLSVLTLTFNEDSAHNINRQLVIERLQGAKTLLPKHVHSPSMMPLASSAATIMTIGFTSDDKDLQELRSFIEQYISPALLSVKGVADINVFGGEEKSLNIILNANKLAQSSISIDTIIRSIKYANIKILGSLNTENQQIQIVSDSHQPLHKINSINISNQNGQIFKLTDLATITFNSLKPISKASIEGKSGVIVMVIGQLNADTVEITEAIDGSLSNLNRLILNNNIKLHDQIFRPANYILKSLHSIIDHLVVGGFLVLIVLILFMSNIKAALISALAIPISLILAAILTLSTGTSLNIMVIGGLAIALGEVVDDAIIDVENILRRLRENSKLNKPLNNLRVIYGASIEVRGSVVYASLIVMLVFVPLLLLSGVVGRMFAPLGLAYILAIFSSLISALTLTPALSSISFKGYLEKKDPLIIRYISPIYKIILLHLSKFPKFSSIIALIICFSGIFLLPKLMIGFLPELREGHFMIHTSSLTGSSLSETMRIGNRITNNILKIEGVKTMSQWAGRAERGADTFGSHYSEFEVELENLSGKDQQVVFNKIRNVLINTPGISFEANSFLIERVDETSSGFSSPIVIQVFGSDLEEIDVASNKIFNKLNKNNIFLDLQIKSVLGKPQINIHLDDKLLMHYNISIYEANMYINSALDGLVLDSYYDDMIKIPIVLSYSNNTINHIDGIRNLKLIGNNGEIVKLKDVAKIFITNGRYNIFHDAGRKVQIITAKARNGETELALNELKNLLSKIDLGDNIYTNITGSAVESKKARIELIKTSGIILLAILFLVLIAIGNIRNTFLILINMPFALIGGVIAAIIGGGLLSIGSIVGFVTLFGITLRNSIMLVSHYQHLVFKDGCEWCQETAIRGAIERLPSILMTGLVTGLAMLPIAFDADNAGREIMGPMASIIIGGLATSTILNLLILPSFMLAFGSFKKKELI